MNAPMALDWASEHFVRLFTRETDDDLLLSWEARAIWHELLKKFDKQGRLATKRGVRGLAALIRLPLEVVERALPELINDGRLKEQSGTYFAPNYQPANYTPRSPAARMSDLRTRTGLREGSGAPGDLCSAPHDADGGTGEHNETNNLKSVDDSVTSSNAESQNVTARSHIRSGQGRSEQVHSARTRARGAIPSDWSPRERERLIAKDLGLNADAEAQEFLTYWQGDGRAKADWDLAFESRLRSQARRKKPEQAQEIREIPEL